MTPKGQQAEAQNGIAHFRGFLMATAGGTFEE
jgi:hypothetical protein